MPHTIAPETRFWRYVDKGAECGCWLWTGAKFTNGYGSLTIRARNPHVQVRAHRFSYEMAKGPIPPGAFVCHRCDRPACVNPDHLFLGDARSNRRDMIAKDRGNFPKGARHVRATMTAAGVIYARTEVAGGRYITDVARELGVHCATLTQAVRGSTWAHVHCEADRIVRRAIPPEGGRKRSRYPSRSHAE